MEDPKSFFKNDICFDANKNTSISFLYSFNLASVKNNSIKHF